MGHMTLLGPPVRVSIGWCMGRGKHLLRKIQVAAAAADHEPVMRVGPFRALRRRDRRDEAGASLVEFALVLPLFFMLMLGMFTGGLAYSQRQSVTQGVREGARYGATLPNPGTSTWLNQVASVTLGSSDSELGSGRPARYLCIAFVDAAGVATSLVFDPGASVGTASTQRCLDAAADPRSEPRVQIVARRTAKLEAVVFSRDLLITARSVARFEAQ
jgi:hypothetical protein